VTAVTKEGKDTRVTKTTYAQSSDIKSRTYLEYRRDMKKKAIAELETVDWLADKLSNLYDKKVTVRKSGGDAFIWFLRKGGISGESDFEALYDDKQEKFEFQYADSSELDFFDFKVSKVGRKVKGQREPYTDKKFIYILKPTAQYGIIEPQWIMENGKEEGVPAWGNRTAFRIPNNKFKEILKTDTSLEMLVKSIDMKTRLLNFQFEFIKLEETKLSTLLQTVIDKEEIVKFTPSNLDTFYKVCFIIDKLGETPVNANLWFVYVLSFFNESLDSYQMAQLIYCIDFLYSKIELQDNELARFVETVEKITLYCNRNQKNDGRFGTSLDLFPREEIRHLLFIVNLLEDLIQDSIFYYGTKFKPIDKIFEHVQYIEEVSRLIT
jgi:hypothetical protein